MKQTVRGKKVTDGDVVKLTRVLSQPNIYDFDPFLMLDCFDSKKPEDYIKGFPPHPHRGIELITYVIYGEVEHKDSLGNKGIIKNGKSQWMTAGSGVIHQEMPKESEHLLGIQLWINLPKKDKMVKPVYRDIKGSDIAIIEEENDIIRIISGEYKGEKAIYQGDYIKIQFYDITLKANKGIEIDIKEGDNAFIFTVIGNLDTEVGEVLEKTAILLENNGKIKVKAKNEDARFLFFSGKALKKNITWGGPIVMNTDEEIQEAFQEINDGIFIKKY